jgi:hypothetical protein
MTNSENPKSPRHFVRTKENGSLIRSTCTWCGASQMVSETDGSLERWENGHDCDAGSSTML